MKKLFKLLIVALSALTLTSCISSHSSCSAYGEHHKYQHNPDSWKGQTSVKSFRR